MNDRLTMADVAKLYRNEWVLAEVVEEDPHNNPTVIKVIGHSKSKEAVQTQLDGKVGDLSIFYTGPLPRSGHIPHI